MKNVQIFIYYKWLRHFLFLKFKEKILENLSSFDKNEKLCAKNRNLWNHWRETKKLNIFITTKSKLY
jgi:hypothetical protein